MKEENKKRINKLIIPFTRRTLAILGAVTISTTGLASCKKEDKNNSSDLTTSTITSSDTELEVSEEILGSSTISTEESSNIDNSQLNSSKTDKVSSKPKNDTTKSSSKITNNNDSVQTPSVTTPETVMPNTLTAQNINDIEVFNYFANHYYINNDAPITFIGYRYNNEVYYANVMEHKLFLLWLNSDYINVNTYNQLFQNLSVEDMNKMVNFVGGLLNCIDKQDFNIYFDKIVVDKNKREFLKLLQLSIRTGKIKQFVIDYMNGNQKYYNYQDDIVIDYFVNSSASTLLPIEDFVSTGWFNNYNNVNEKMKEHIANLHYKYNGKQYIKE